MQKTLLLSCLLAALATNVGASSINDLYSDAQARLRAGDVNGAIIQLKNTLQRSPNMLAAHVSLGHALKQAGQLKAAQASFQTALSLGAARSEVVTHLARLEFDLGAYSQALSVLDERTVSSLEPRLRSEALTIIALCQSRVGDDRPAREALIKAKALDPLSAQPWLVEVPMLLKAGDTKGALAAGAQATQLAPGLADAWSVLANAQRQAGDTAAAMASLNKAIKLQPLHAESLLARASLHLNQGHDALAQADITAAGPYAENDPRLAYLKAVLLDRAGKPTEARAAYSNALALITAMPPGMPAGDEQLLLNGALAARALGDNARTQEQLAGLLARNPKNAAAQLLRAELLVEAGEHSRARPLLQNLRTALPQNARVLMMLGQVELAAKRHAEAAELFQQAYALEGNASTLRDLGRAELGLGREATAIAHLEKALNGPKPDIGAGMQLAMTHARAGRGEQALKVAERVLALNPKNPALLNFHANVKGFLGDKAGAGKIWADILAATPGFRPAVINLSWLDMEQGRLDPARQRLTAALQREARDPDILFQLGRLELQAGAPARAEGHFQRAYDMQNRDIRPGLALVDLWMGQRQVDKALRMAMALSDAYKDQVNAHLVLARVQAARQDRAGARSALTAAGRAAGTNPGALLSVARMQVQEGDLEGANYNLSKALQAAPNAIETLTFQVELAHRRGDTKATDAALKTLLSLHPKHPNALLARGGVALSRNQAAAALQDFRAAMELQPRTPTAILLARTLLDMGQPDKAVATLANWAKDHPKDTLARAALAELQVGSGQLEAASQTYREVLALDANNPRFLNNYADLLARMQHPQALEAAKRSHQASPEDSVTLARLGTLQVRAGQVDQGLATLREGRFRNPSNANLRWQLASALAQTGRKAEAKAELQEALRIDPRLKTLPDVQKLESALRNP